jgi:thymidine phosphorylase
MTHTPQSLIARKRDRHALGPDEIAEIVRGIASGAWSEAQTAAFAMAAYLNGLDTDERVALTRAMADSGTRLDWSAVRDGRPIIDKHSSGGIGDKVSLILAPALAACGAVVPMISGRGLGHTGGTLDKLEAIPGYRVGIGIGELKRVTMEAGCAIVGATADIAPADKALYAVRDVTATVESEGLIVASILSKKLAAGLDALVLDVKSGSGAFMAAREQAVSLARALVSVANGAGLPTTAQVTDMNQVLGQAAGNALEIAETIAVLLGEETDRRLLRVTASLGGALLAAVGLAPDAAAGEARIRARIADGSAAERFARMVAALGGPADLIERPETHLQQAPEIRPVVAARAGTVARIDVRALGLAIVDMGGGRARADAAIDPRVGLTHVVAPGQQAAVGQPLATIHAADEAHWQRAAIQVAAAIVIDPDLAPAPLAADDPVLQVIGPD